MNSLSKYSLEQSPLYQLKSKLELAEVLLVSLEKLNQLSSARDLYLKREKVCGQGKPRFIQEPKQDLKVVQKRIESLLKRVKLPEFVHGLGEKRCAIHNAEVHANSPCIRKLDIKNFFPSVPKRRVYWFFHKVMKCSKSVSGTLSSILTVDDHLPTGSPSSPLLSYFSYIDMWAFINETVTDSNCIMTVYIDDITLSGLHIPKGLTWQVETIIHGFGLRINAFKKRGVVNNSGFEVTGVILGKENKLRLPNRIHHKMHKVRRKLERGVDQENREKTMQELQGLRSYAKQIELTNPSSNQTSQ